MTTQALRPQSDDATALLDAYSQAVIAVVERVAPSVVHVRSRMGGGSGFVSGARARGHERYPHRRRPSAVAERGGLRPGDILVTFDGARLERLSDLQRLLGANRIGRPVDALVIRRGECLHLTLVAQEAT